MKRTASVLAVLLALLGLAMIAWPWRSDVPEPADWRAYLREPSVGFTGPWFSFGGRPNHVVQGFLERGLFATGVDVELLVLGNWLLAAACVACVLALLRATAPAVALLVSALALSPAFAADWLLVERVRLFVPAACACALVWLLRAPGTRMRRGLALVVAVVAVFSHEAGALVWAAVLPLVVTSARGPGKRALAPALAFVLVANVALAACYDESARPFPGLPAAMVTHPLSAVRFASKTLGLAVPDVLPSTDTDSVVLGVLLVLALMAGAVALARGAPEIAARGLPLLCLGLAGLAQGLAVAHTQVPQAVTDAVLRELSWGTWLLPVGALGLWLQLAPGVARRVAPLGFGASVLLLAQDWHRGAAWLQAEGRFLQQSAALMVFADCERERPSAPRPAVPSANDRAALRAAGQLAGMAPLGDTGLASLPLRPDAAAGSVQEVTVRGAQGTLRRDSGADLVLLTRQRLGAPVVLCKVAVPNQLDAGATLSWQTEFGELEPFAEGEEVGAFAFDHKTRTITALPGRFRCAGGHFMRDEAAK